MLLWYGILVVLLSEKEYEDQKKITERKRSHKSNLQVLITEAEGDNEKDKGGKHGDGKASKFVKHGKAKKASESHVELDSRLLSALLTVSFFFFFNIFCWSSSLSLYWKLVCKGYIIIVCSLALLYLRSLLLLIHCWVKPYALLKLS